MSQLESDNSLSLLDQTALGEVFAEHEARLLAMLQRRIDPALARRVAAGEILSKTYLDARRKWSAFREQEAMSAYVWLYGIARDCLIVPDRRIASGRAEG